MTLERWPNEAAMIGELYGGAWADPEGFSLRREPAGCVICRNGRPFGIIGELEHIWITTDPEVALFGYLCVIAKRHAAEPFDLPETEQLSFWKEAMAVARALNDFVQPVKMNYEIHGNTLPHLHMHLYPRQIDDAFVGRPIDMKETHHRYTKAELTQLRRMLTEVRKSSVPSSLDHQRPHPEPLVIQSSLSAPGPSFHRGVSALFIDGDRVLLAHRTHERDWAPDTWDVPGGHVEDDESETEALAREVREELGIEILEESAGLSARLVGPNFEIAYFTIDEWTGVPSNAAPDEHAEIEWVPLSELGSLALADPEILPIIRSAGQQRPSEPA